MTERFKLVNKSRINNNRIRLIKTGTSTSQLDPLFGAVYENESEVGLCLAPSTIISCVGAKVESEEIVLDSDNWAVEVDGVLLTDPNNVNYTAMVEILEQHGVRVTELKPAIQHPIYCDGAVSKESLKMQDGGWLLEVDGVNMGGPYDLASLDEYTRRREVRVIVPPPLVCNVESSDTFYFSEFNPEALKQIINVDTGQVILDNNDGHQSNLTTDKVMWIFDQNYGRGFIRNLTDSCLLICFEKWEDYDELNAGIYYEAGEGNATMIDIDGIYYISLGPAKYTNPTLSYSLIDEADTIDNSSGASAGNVVIQFVVTSDEPVNPAGVTFTYAGVEHILLNGDVLDIPIPRIQPNTSLSENVYLVRNDIVVNTPDVYLNGSSSWDYDLWQTTSHWDEYAERTDLQIIITVNDYATIFTGNRQQMDHANTQRPSATIGTLMTLQANPKWEGCVVRISETIIDTPVNSDGYVEFIIPPISVGLWDVELINPDRIDEREFPSQNPVTRLRTVNFI